MQASIAETNERCCGGFHSAVSPCYPRRMISLLTRWTLAGLLFAPPATAAGLQAQFTWQGAPACSHTPPAFTVRDVPPRTAALRFTMHDLQVPAYPHGGGTVRYTGSPDIPPGAFDYNGPCPPPGSRHQYRWTVEALDAAGRVLARTAVTHAFPP
jgi:hypothetical protein